MHKNAYVSVKDITEILKILSEPTRIRILNLLANAPNGLCVCEIVDTLCKPQYAISRALIAFKKKGIVMERKEGRWVIYTLKETQLIQKIKECLNTISIKDFENDLKILKERLSLRKNGKCAVGINSKEWKELFKKVKRRLKYE